MNKKVLILDNSIAATGAFKSIYLFSNALRNEYHFSFGINKNSELKDHLVSENFDILELSYLEIQKNYKIIFYFPFLIYNSIKIVKYLRRNRIGILHVNDIYNMTGVFIKIFNPDLFLVYHIRLLNNSYVSYLYGLWGRLINKFADRIICVSRIVADSFPFNSNKTILIYDSLAIDKINIKSRPPGKSEFIHLYYIGNYTEGKGQDLALKAFSIAVRIKANLRLTFIGGTLLKRKNIRYKKQLIKTSETLGISHLISFKGLSKNIEEDYLKADIILNFSENESFSMVCLEALAYGRPLIASESGGPEEIIDQYVDGILVPNRDIDKMADSIVKLSSSVEMMIRFSENGPKKVKEMFNVNINKDKLQQVYTQGIR